MILFFISILMPLISAVPFEGPSYRSSVMEGDKPILRMMEEPPEPPEPVSEKPKPSVAPDLSSNEKMVKDMSLLIQWLIDTFGYDIIPEVHRRNDESGDFEEPEKKVLRASDTKKRLKKASEKHKKVHSLRSKGEDHSKTPEKSSASSDPTWMPDLKEFIKDLVSRFGQQDLDRYTKPVVAALEKKHNIEVTDIDVDQYGEVLINYVDKVNTKKDKDAKTLRF